MEIYTIKEASKVLKLPQETLRKYLRQGILEGSKIGTSWRVTDEAIKQFLKENSNRNNEK